MLSHCHQYHSSYHLLTLSIYDKAQKYKVLTVHTAAVWCPNDSQEQQTTRSRPVQC